MSPEVGVTMEEDEPLTQATSEELEDIGGQVFYDNVSGAALDQGLVIEGRKTEMAYMKQLKV